MAAKKVNRKRRVKKNIEAGIAHIHSTFNNTIIMITDTHGNALAWSSAGSLGFKGSKKINSFCRSNGSRNCYKSSNGTRIKDC